MNHDQTRQQVIDQPTFQRARRREASASVAVAAAPIRCSLAELAPARLRAIAASGQEPARFDAYLREFHPLGYAKPFGFFARYWIEAGGSPLGCMLLSGAARALAPRDRFIGWCARVRRRNLPWVVGNSRFLIFPWVAVPHLASHALAQLARQLPDDWAQRWSFRPLLLETFVDPAYWRGSCYLAAGWQLLGSTSCRGLARPAAPSRNASSCCPARSALRMRLPTLGSIATSSMRKSSRG